MRKTLQALTIVEVMLSLAIVALGIFAGVEMLGRILAAQRTQNDWGKHERVLAEVRRQVEQIDAAELVEKLEAGGWQLDGARVKAPDEESPYPEAALALTMEILDEAGETIFETQMLRVHP